jgi:MbtH protein
MNMGNLQNLAYKVVVNHEDQYSLWPLCKKNSAGWRDGGLVGTKDECLNYISKVWTDMRPLSLRQGHAIATLDSGIVNRQRFLSLQTS